MKKNAELTTKLLDFSYATLLDTEKEILSVSKEWKLDPEMLVKTGTTILGMLKYVDFKNYKHSWEETNFLGLSPEEESYEYLCKDCGRWFPVTVGEVQQILRKHKNYFPHNLCLQCKQTPIDNRMMVALGDVLKNNIELVNNPLGEKEIRNQKEAKMLTRLLNCAFAAHLNSEEEISAVAQEWNVSTGDVVKTGNIIIALLPYYDSRLYIHDWKKKNFFELSPQEKSYGCGCKSCGIWISVLVGEVQQALRKYKNYFPRNICMECKQQSPDTRLMVALEEVLETSEEKITE